MDSLCERIDIRYNPVTDRLDLDLFVQDGLKRFEVTARIVNTLVAKLFCLSGALSISESEWAIASKSKDINRQGTIPTVNHTAIQEISRKLVTRLQIQTADAIATIYFQEDSESRVILSLRKHQLIAFLRALFVKCLEADWNLEVWPEFIVSNYQKGSDHSHPVH